MSKHSHPQTNKLRRRAEAESGAAPSPRQVFDPELDKMVTRTEEQHQRAMVLMRMVEAATLLKAIALARLTDGKHYLDLGCSSFKEYADTMLPIGYRSAKQYVSIGRKFGALLPEFDPDEATPASLLEGEIAESDELGGFASMGVRKLYEMTKLEDEQFSNVVEKGKLVMPDGETEFTIDDLRDMASREFSDQIKRARLDKEAYRARIAQLEEEQKMLESEREADAERIREAEERLEMARDLERQYGEAARTTEEKWERLEKARALCRDLRAVMLGDGFTITSEDVQSIHNFGIEVIREMLDIATSAQVVHGVVLEMATDTAMHDAHGEHYVDTLDIDEIEAYPAGEAPTGDGAGVEVDYEVDDDPSDDTPPGLRRVDT